MSGKKHKNAQKTVQELESPVVDFTVNPNMFDKDPRHERPMGRAYLNSRREMPEDQLFEFAEYRPQDAERTGYSNYSYWRSVWANFLKKKSAVIMSVIFILLFAFTFIGSAIGKYQWDMPPAQSNSYIEAYKSIDPSPEGYAKAKLSVLYEDLSTRAAAIEQAKAIPEKIRIYRLLDKRFDPSPEGYAKTVMTEEYNAGVAEARHIRNTWKRIVKTILWFDKKPDDNPRMTLDVEKVYNSAVAKAEQIPENTRVEDLVSRSMWTRVVGNFYWNREYWFGTNGNGKDYWAQVWHATRQSILLAVLVSAAQILLGVIIGLVWGYVRKLDRFFTELYNLIDNIPTIIYMTLIALMVGKTFFTIGVALVLFGWLATARNVRNLVFMYRDREYNLASRCLGTSLVRVLFRNIFPYLISVIILRLALAIPTTIAYETTLTYLGLMDITEPSLGNLLREARDHFLDYPHMLVFPAIIVSIITVTFYLVGNAFSDASDPRNHV